MLLKRLFGRRAEPKAPAAQQTQTQIATALASSEASVRREACRQLSDLQRLRTLAETDADAGVRELADARYRRLLCGLDAKAPSLEIRLAELTHAANPMLLAQVATQAEAAELRLAAIGLVENAEVLASCAIRDLVAANRLAAAERVNQKQALEQIIKGIGKRDKRVYRLVRERLKQLSEQEQRPQRARELGAVLCERLERLGRFDHWQQDHAVLGHLEQQWRGIEADAEPALRADFERLRQRFLDGYQAYQQQAMLKQAAAQAQSEEAEPGHRQDTAHAASHPEGDQHSDAGSQAGGPITQPTSDPQATPTPQSKTLLQDASAPVPSEAAAQTEAGAGQAAMQTLAGLETEAGAETEAGSEQAAAQLLADLRRQTERSSLPDQRTLSALRKRRRSLANTPASNTDIGNSEGSGGTAAEHSAGNASQAEGAIQAASMTPQQRLQQIDQLLAGLEQRLERHQKQLQRKLQTLSDRLSELEARLNEGELKKADPLYQSICATLDQARRAGIGRDTLASVDERLRLIAPQLRELRLWRRWSTDEHRAQLCAQIEALAADTEHGEEPSIHRLEQLKGQWQQLDRQGTPADEALWARFRQAAEQIHQRCQPYLEAQTALRSEHRKQREALAKKLEDFLGKVDWERVDWKKLHRAEREMRQAWARLAEAPGGDQQGNRDRAIEGRFRRALRRLDQSLTEERERNQAEKQQLLEQMRALAEQPDLRAAIEAAKQLQRQWRTTVPGKHRDENALWQAFRTASDVVFARRAAETEAHAVSLREHQATREAICEELLALASAETSTSAEVLEHQIGELKTRWQDTEALPVPRQAQSALNRQWREALALARGRLSSLHERERWAGLERLALRAAYCDDAGRSLARQDAAFQSPGTDANPVNKPVDEPVHAPVDAPANQPALACAQLEQGWDALPAIEDEALAKALTQAFEQVLSSCREPHQRDALHRQLQANLAQRESLCLSLEIFCQVESPSALQGERMQRQVERLRDRMGDGDSKSEEEISTLLRDWYLSCPAAASAALEARFAQIKRALGEGGSRRAAASPDDG
jgi:hypothetical protein